VQPQVKKIPIKVRGLVKIYWYMIKTKGCE